MVQARPSRTWTFSGKSALSEFDKFERIKNPLEVESVIQETTRGLGAAMLWTKNQSLVINTHFKLWSKTDQRLYAHVPLGVTGPGLEDHLRRVGSQEVYCSVSLTRANIFFRCTYTGWDAAGLIFSVPKEVYKVQRRNDLRFSIPEGHVLKVTFEDPTFPEKQMTRKVIDLSAGGLAFLVPETESAFFVQDQKLKGLSFRIKTRDITTQAVVKHKAPLSPNTRLPGVKIGVAFDRLSAGDQQWIHAYVFEETRKMVSKFL